jgi:hypothetical protein
MSERDPPSHWAIASQEDAGWRPVGSAFVASAAIHAIAFAAFAAILVREPAAATFRAEPVPIQALLVSPARATPAAPVVRTAPEPAPRRTPVVKLVPVQAPWAGQRYDPTPPEWIHSRPMISEGVVMFETRNITMLGEKIERLINERYAGAAEFPIALKPAEELGYPLDVLESGIEGRVFVWFGVDEEGKVVDREGIEGPSELVDWVLERLDRLVDKPARNGDKPVPGWVALEIEFSRDAARTARELRAAEQERLDRAEMRAKARAESGQDATRAAPR